MAPPFAYFDTSVVVKGYVREPSSTMARALLRRHRCVSSAILRLEVVSALNRRRAAVVPRGTPGRQRVQQFLTTQARRTKLFPHHIARQRRAGWRPRRRGARHVLRSEIYYVMAGAGESAWGRKCLPLLREGEGCGEGVTAVRE